MSSFFPDFIRAQLFATPTLFSGKSIKCVLFRQAPEFDSADPSYKSISTVPELLAKRGWRETVGDGYPLTTSLALDPVLSKGNNRYALISTLPFTGLSTTGVEAKAAAFVLSGAYGGKADPIIFVTTTPFGVEPTIVTGSDGITSAPDYSLTQPGLSPTVGTLTSPNPGPLPTQFTIVCKLKGPTAGTDGICSVWGASGQFGWNLQRSSAGAFVFEWSTNGTATASITVAGPATTGDIQYVAAEVVLNDGSGNRKLTAWSSVDGTVWVKGATTTTAGVVTVFNSTASLRIGSRGLADLVWDNTLHYVGFRSGAGGPADTSQTLVWRFDASEYPNTGTAYQDNKLRTWTMTTSGSIFTPNNRALFSWAVPKTTPPPGETTVLNIFEGPGEPLPGDPPNIALFEGAPVPFESSHTQHIWLYPQRANMIANPSFEAGANDVGYPGYIDFPTTVTGNQASVTYTMPVDASASIRVDCERPLGDGNIHGVVGGNFFLMYLRYTDNDLYFYFYDTTPTAVPVKPTLGQLNAAGVPESGRWQYKITWNATTDTQSLHARDPALNRDLMDETGWVLVTSVVQAGKQLRSGSSPQLVNNTSWRGNGKVFREVMEVNGSVVLDYDFRFFTDLVGTTTVLPTGQTATFTKNATTPLTATAPVDAGTSFWSSNGSINQVTVPNPIEEQHSNAGRFVLAGQKVVAESNVFPTSREEVWSVQMLAKGSGILKIGFVWWDDDFAETSVDWGNRSWGAGDQIYEGSESWELSTQTFRHIATFRNPIQTYEGMLRVECSGGDLTLDSVLVEKGYLKDWPYFDGDSTYGANGDYCWYGTENDSSRRGASYSLWYNNRNAIYGRVFARSISETELVTDEIMAKQGFVYRWVPAGTMVIPHFSVLYPGDPRSPVPPKAAGVIGYRVNPITDLDKVVNPWTHRVTVTDAIGVTDRTTAVKP